MAYYRCMMSGGSGDFPVTLTVTCDSNYEGETLYLTKGLTVLSEIVPSNLTVTFTFPENGTWVLSNSLNQETETFVNVGEYECSMLSIPDGKTVTPTDDIQIWLNCANIWDKTYTTLAEVLADTDTLSALIASENAVDYMVRSTTWAASIALVPTMISNTEPSGIVTVSGVYNNDGTYTGYKAFDRNDNTFWLGTYADANAWIGYEFEDEITVRALTCRSTQNGAKTFTIRTSINGTDWSDVSTHTIPNDVEETISITPTTSKYWRLQCSAKYGDMCGFREIQFHSYSITDNSTAMSYIGLNNYASNTLLANATWCEAICNSEYFESVLNVKVPAMTSNTTPSGVVSDEESSANAYTAFDNDVSTRYIITGDVPSRWIQYQFASPIMVRKVGIQAWTTDPQYGYWYIPKKIQIQGSADGVTFVSLQSFDVSKVSASQIFQISPASESDTYYPIVRFVLTPRNENSEQLGNIQLGSLFIYGREDV